MRPVMPATQRACLAGLAMWAACLPVLAGGAEGRQCCRGRGRRRARQRTWPLRLVLYAMTTACLALVILSFWRNGWQVENLHDNPLIGAGAGALQQLGSKSTPKILQPHNQWWRFLSSAFLPSGAAPRRLEAHGSSLVVTGHCGGLAKLLHPHALPLS